MFCSVAGDNFPDRNGLTRVGIEDGTDANIFFRHNSQTHEIFHYVAGLGIHLLHNNCPQFCSLGQETLVVPQFLWVSTLGTP